jgi:hypothetical protein
MLVARFARREWIRELTSKVWKLDEIWKDVFPLKLRLIPLTGSPTKLE